MFSEKTAFILALIAVAVCYANSLPNDFVFDDGSIVGSNPAIRSINPILFLTTPYWGKQQYEGIYRPFTILSLSVDYAIWKRWAPGFRITNLTLHAINGFLLFLLCQSLVGEAAVSLSAMLIFLMHPVQTEAVTSIVGRSELFATGFFIGAWLLFRRRRTVWAAILFLFALLSKENAIVLPAVLILDACLGAEVPAAPGHRAYYRFLTLGAVAAGYLALRFYVLGGLGIPVSAQYLGGHWTYFQRLMTAGRVFIQYLRLLFFPVNVAGDYDFNSIPIAQLSDWDAWVGLALTIGIAVWALLYIRRERIVSLGVLFAFAAFAPASNWIFPISVLMAERFLYLPLAGLSLAAAVAAMRLRNARWARVAAAGVLVTAIVLCNSHDYIRRSDFTFFANMVRVVPNSAKARLGYGYALIQAGRNQEAARELEAGLQIIPNYPELLTTLALTRTTPTDCSNAWPLLRRALEISPEHADTHRRMGDCYFKEGKIHEAEAMYHQAVDSIPYPDSMLYFMWGRSLEDSGQTGPAVAAYRRGALIDPDNILIQRKLAALGSSHTSLQ